VIETQEYSLPLHTAREFTYTDCTLGDMLHPFLQNVKWNDAQVWSQATLIKNKLIKRCDEIR